MKLINVQKMKDMFRLGTEEIAKNYKHINDLNVFPVPDGDTGTNMKITTSGAFNDILNFQTQDISSLGKAFSRALLMNARGNSGVIMSQIIKGFITPFIEGKDCVTIEELKECFIQAKIVAYESVSNPIEGTILTVIRVTSEKVSGRDFGSCLELFEFVVSESKNILDKTPEMLEELKKVGVVDSGGYGLWCFFTGMFNSLNNSSSTTKIIKKESKKNIQSVVPITIDDHDNQEGFGYCSEIIMKIGSKIQPTDPDKYKFNFSKFKKELSYIGDSMVCVQDGDIIKVHIHTMVPHKFLQISRKYGEFIKLKFDNMTEQFYERMELQGIKVIDNKKPIEKKVKLIDATSLIITVPSTKIEKIFINDYGFKNIVNTSKNGNPSIQELLTMIQKTKTNKVIIITDDSNIILAAVQVANIVKDSIDVRVIKGSNAFEALVASLEYKPEATLDINEKEMSKAVKNSTSAIISKAVKDVEYSHIKLFKNDYITIMNKKILIANKSKEFVLKSTIDLLMKKSKEVDILIIIYGNKKDEKLLEIIEKYVSETYNIFCELKDGGQKVFDFFIGVQ